MAGGAWLYILRCTDGSYYVGSTRISLEIRIAQHNDGTFPGYTAARRPVEPVFSQWFDRITDAIENERKLKGWSRAKKGSADPGRLRIIATTGKAQITSSFEAPGDGFVGMRSLAFREGQSA